MKKLFLIPLLACYSCVMAFAVNVGTKAELVAALANGGDITLTANISSDVQLDITKATVIDGNGFAVKGTQQYVFQVGADATLKNLVIYAAKSKAGRGLLVNDNTNDIVLSLDNVTINATERGMDVWYSNNVTLNIKDSKIQLVPNGGAAQDATTGMPATDNYDVKTSSVSSGYSRGVNIGQLTNSSIVLENTTVQGFFYNLNNIGGTMLGSKVTASNCVFKGRAAFNIWGEDGEYVCNDCAVTGINNFAGSQESFASFVLNGQGTISKRNKLTINGGTIVSAYFDATGMANPNARQYLLRDLGEDNVIVINNSSYTCTKEANEEGDAKGGVIEYASSSTNITINGGSYDCPSIIGGALSDGAGNTGSVVITGGDFNVNTVSPDMTDPDMYSTVDVQGGTYNIDLADLHAPDDESNGLISAANEVVANQDGTTSIVPAGTAAATSQAAASEIEWNNPAHWTVPSASSNVVIAANQTVTLEGAAGAAYRLDMGDGAKLIVKEGTTLTIGKGGVALNNGGAVNPQIIIEQGAKVITYGLMYNSVAENLIIKASAAKHGVLLIDPNAQAYGDNHPMGTVEFVTKSFFKDNDHYQFERFGIPTWNTLESIDCDVDGLSTGIYIYENNGWQDLGYLKKGVAFKKIDRLNKPFVACNLIAYQEAAGAAYKFAGSLMGNSDAALNANLEWNPFANSYTGDVDIIKYLEGLASGVNVDPTVYLATPTGLGTYSWDPVDAEWAAGEKLAPMQAFILHNHGQEAEVSAIDYSEMVWAPGSAASAPRRSAAASDNTAKLRIIVSNEQGAWDNVKMTESATNMHNATKYMNDEVNIYAMADEKCGIIATDNLENTYVGFSTVNGGKYTISFANVEGREFTLVDHETGAQVAMAEGNKYEFTAAANSANDYRFEIVESAKLPTAIENTEAVKSAKGIYTITGQFLGEMNVWNTLPAGVYVVNGEKRVK